MAAREGGVSGCVGGGGRGTGEAPNDTAIHCDAQMTRCNPDVSGCSLHICVTCCRGVGVDVEAVGEGGGSIETPAVVVVVVVYMGLSA